MSNIVEVRQWVLGHQFELEAFGLCEWIDSLQGYVVAARRKVDRAKTVGKVLEYYAEFLRRYYELHGGFQIILRQLQSYAANEKHGDVARSVTGLFETIHQTVTGPHPWLSLPNKNRTAYMCVKQLAAVNDFLLHSLRILTDLSERKTA